MIIATGFAAMAGFEPRQVVLNELGAIVLGSFRHHIGRSTLLLPAVLTLTHEEGVSVRLDGHSGTSSHRVTAWSLGEALGNEGEGEGEEGDEPFSLTLNGEVVRFDGAPTASSKLLLLALRQLPGMDREESIELLQKVERFQQSEATRVCATLRTLYG
jgi:hypothetical protein